MSNGRAQNPPESCTPIENNLPVGWIEITLDQILQTLESGSRPKGGVRGIKEGVPSIGGEHINENGEFRFETIKFVPHNFFKQMNHGHIQTGDILIVKDGATTGKVALVRDDFPYNPAAVNEHVFICRPEEGIHPLFLFYFLFSKEGQDRILENFRGSAQGGINQSFAPRTGALLAPLAEQKRIAAKVEELLARVNATKERLAKVPLILKHFRQAVLAAACSGRLTSDWREKQSYIQHAKDLLLSILAERRQFMQESNPKKRGAPESLHPYREAWDVDPSEFEELPDGWVWASGEDLFAWSSGDFLPKKKQEKGPYPIYGGNGITGYHSEYLVDHPTLVIGRVGALCGNVYITSDKAWITDNAIYASYVPTKLNLQYVKMVFTQSNLNANAGGSGQPFVNQTVLNKVAFPLPPLAEQHEIVRRVESMFKLADAVEKRVAAATARAEKLPQSILAKAFRGELVPTEAELARREGRSYEPASELLARIKSERESKRVPEKVRRTRN